MQWSDPTTLELLEQIIDRAQRLPVLAVITFRPEFTPPWPGQAHITTLALNRLSRRQGAAMVAEVTGGRTLPAVVLEEIVSKTDGVPLFVEELTKADGHCVRNSGTRRSSSRFWSGWRTFICFGPSCGRHAP